MIDPVTVITTLLRGDVAFQTAMNVVKDGGVYRSPPGFPSGAVVNNAPPRGLLIQLAGGEQDDSNPRIEARLLCRLYASSGTEAMKLYRALWVVFYDAQGIARGRRRVGRWLIYGASLTLPTTTTEPDTSWPLVLTTLSVRLSALEG